MPISDDELIRELVTGGLDERAAKAVLTRLSAASGASTEPKIYIGAVSDSSADSPIGTDMYVPLVDETFGNAGPFAPSIVSDIQVISAGQYVVSEVWWEAINFADTTHAQFVHQTYPLTIRAWKYDGSQILTVSGPAAGSPVDILKAVTPGNTTDFNFAGFAVVGTPVGSDLSLDSVGIKSAAGGAFYFAILATPHVLAL